MNIDYKNAREGIHPELREMFVDHKNRICYINHDTGELIPYRFGKPRPRPLMFIGWRNGKKCYVRKQSLSYFQLKEKYPPPFDLKKALKPPHIFQKRHHLFHKPTWEPIYGYIIAGCGITIFAGIVIFYLYLLSRAYL